MRSINGPDEGNDPHKSEAAEYGIMLPCDPEQFSEFISGLLGKPQTIEKIITGSFEVDRDEIISLFHLIDVRLQQQNHANLVQFTARIMYDDNSSVLLNNLEDFKHYAEIRPISSVGAALSWTYLILFKGKKVPEKQEISVIFKGSEDQNGFQFDDDEYVISRPLRWMNPSCVFLSINHTERTWGIDIESLLTGQIRTLLKPVSKFKKFVYAYSNRIGALIGATFFASAVSMLLYNSSKFIKSYTVKLADLLEKLPPKADVSSAKIDFLTQIIATGVWPRFIFSSVLFGLMSLVLSLFIGILVSTRLDKKPESYVLLSKFALDRKKRHEARLRRDWVTFYLSIAVSIVTGIFSNVLFSRYFSSLS